MGIFADLSKYQGIVDFAKLKNAVDGVILRVQYGYTTPDPKYAEYVAGCKANNIPFQTYAFFVGFDVPDAVAEAKTAVTRSDKSSEILWVDVEKMTCKNQSDFIPAVQAYIDYLKANGVNKVGLYSYEGFYKQYGLSAIKNIDALWLAAYGVNDGKPHIQPTTYCDLWQYTSTATLPGISGNIDASMIPVGGKKPVSFFTGIFPNTPTPVTPPVPSKPIPSLSDEIASLKKDVAALKTEVASLKSVPNKTPPPPSNPTPVSKPVYHTVVSGDTVSDLAKKYGISIIAIKVWNKLDDKYTIYSGQKLRIK